MTSSSVPRLLALWSVPRARSTAFLRMMTERRDYTVVHEPFSRVTDFGEVSVGETRCHSPGEVKTALLELAQDRPLFFKDTMDFRYPAVLTDEVFLRAATHTLMIRNPRDVVASHLRVDPRAGLAAVGFEHLVELHETITGLTGTRPNILDGDQLVARPVETVRCYCDHVGIAFDPEALRWSAGPLDEWQHASQGWHDEVASSTGFTATAAVPLPASLQAIADAYVGYHQPFYERLRAEGRSQGAPGGLSDPRTAAGKP
ncbi:hypothetical protein [Nocardioides pantholopis]|uniref:sulfotransferase-like domain-containing protein n=1 Tax=Nocardioides pantholopis TaxID=2483798 RepID=UPI0019D0362A|nr:hypothetical protein [Nocardioides pantholopis]